MRQGSRFASGLLLATLILTAVAGADWVVSIAFSGDRSSEVDVGAYLTCAGSFLVAAGAIGLIVGERPPTTAEFPAPPDPADLRPSV